MDLDLFVSVSCVRSCAELSVLAECDCLTQLQVTVLPSLKQQEIPLDDPESCNMFRPGPDKPLVATRGAVEMYSHEVIMGCWQVLCQKAEEHSGIDYLQVFESEQHNENLWFIEDGPGGAISALLPSDY